MYGSPPPPVAKKRSKSQINRLLSELRYYRELRAETEELFVEYDIELNLVFLPVVSRSQYN